MVSRLTISSATLFVVLLTGCNSASSAANAEQKSEHGMPALPSTFTTAEIHDDSFRGVLAVTETIPSDWKLEGTILQAPCTQIPWPVYRAYSRDGLTEMRQMPALGWRWDPHGYQNQQGCLNLRGPVSAIDFLHHILATMPSSGGIHIVGSMPVPPAFASWAQNFANRLNSQPITYEPAHFTTTADTAALHIQTHNGSFLIDERLKAVVICSVNNHRGSALEGGNCWARVDVLRAPQGRLDPLVRLVDANNLPRPQENPQWQQAVLARNAEIMRQGAAVLFQMQRNAQATFQAMNENFTRTMQQNFENFQAQQEDQFNHFQATIGAQRQMRDNQASDWVDFALDRQTVTGVDGTAKVSNQYTHTWSSTVGNERQWFQTNDVNANPNNVLSGNWTEDTKVHGNGQPYP
jgi:hypothetical protein